MKNDRVKRTTTTTTKRRRRISLRNQKPHKHLYVNSPNRHSDASSATCARLTFETSWSEKYLRSFWVTFGCLIGSQRPVSFNNWPAARQWQRGIFSPNFLFLEREAIHLVIRRGTKVLPAIDDAFIRQQHTRCRNKQTRISLARASCTWKQLEHEKREFLSASFPPSDLIKSSH